MKVKKPKANEEFFDESLPYLLGVGSYQRTTIQWLKVKEIKVVGFIRPVKQNGRMQSK